jgi:hypothetical protein
MSALATQGSQKFMVNSGTESNVTKQKESFSSLALFGMERKIGLIHGR